MDRTALVDAITARGLNDPNLSGPLYRNLARILSDMIDEEELPPATNLPPEREFAEQLGVGRVTVRNAYKELMTQGLIESKHGSGTFVAERRSRISQQLWQLNSFSEDMMLRGKEPGARVLLNKLDNATADEAARLGIEAGTPVIRLDRLRLADGFPMAFERAVVPQHLLGAECVEDASLYHALTKRGHKPVRASQRLKAVSLDPAMAELLGTNRGAPALLIEQTSYRADENIVEYTRSHYRADAFDFVAELKIGEY